MPSRFQFSLRALLVAMLVVSAFFGGIRFEREQRRQADEAAAVVRKAVRAAAHARTGKMLDDEMRHRGAYAGRIESSETQK